VYTQTVSAFVESLNSKNIPSIIFDFLKLRGQASVISPDKETGVVLNCSYIMVTPPPKIK
jgi:hypothetical protein